MYFLLVVPIHFVKTFDWTPLRMSWYGPPSEMNSVRLRYGVKSTVVINFMIYRRSNIISIVALAVPLLLYKATGIVSEYYSVSRADIHPVPFDVYLRRSQTPELPEGDAMAALGFYTADTFGKIVAALLAAYQYG